jgi:DNA polymerase-3 subunit epsilon
MTAHRPMRQVVLDIETTGLDLATGDRVIEIAAVELLDRRISGKHFHSYINPERGIDPGAEAVHGIPSEMLQDKPKFSEVAKLLTDFIEGAEPIAHNAPFDIGFINKEFSLLGLDHVEELCPVVVDTLSLAKAQRPGGPNDLSSLCAAFEIKVSRKNLHGALLDAYLLAEVYLALTRKTLH